MVFCYSSSRKWTYLFWRIGYMGSKSRGKINIKEVLRFSGIYLSTGDYNRDQGRKKKSCSLEIYKLMIRMSSCYIPKIIPCVMPISFPSPSYIRWPFYILNRKFYLWFIQIYQYFTLWFVFLPQKSKITSMS